MKKIIVLWLMACAFITVADTAVTVKSVEARQRYPWNGKVDITYNLSGTETGSYDLSVSAVDSQTGATNVAKNVTGDTSATVGTHHLVWDMNADGLTFVSTGVVFVVSYEEALPLYCVIDLSGGTSAASYPVSYLADVPSGGWTDEYKTTKLVLRRIKAGTFTMGSPSDELGRNSDETQHQVTLTKDFWMGVFQVTQKQYTLIMGSNPSYYTGDARPVENVSYNTIRGSSSGAQWPNSSAVDSGSFLGVLRVKTGLSLDLPTEAQWEYACRAGTTTALNSGKNLTSWGQDSAMDEVGRYWFNGGSSSEHTAVGFYKPNAWGLYDMHGNVLEWCLDWHASYSGDATDPVGASSGSYRVLRGGGWYGYASNCRSANRSAYPSSGYYSYLGFRLACSAGPSN